MANKQFEYEIIVDTSQLDEAEKKVNNLEASTSSTSKSMAKNFDTVGDAAKNTGKSMEVMGTTGKKSMLGLSSGFKGLTVATKSFSKALMANPLFILVAVVLPIVSMLKNMLSEMGLLTIATNALSAALDYVIVMFKQLADWIGITDFAGQARAEQQAKYLEEEAKAIDKLNDSYSKMSAANVAYLKAIGDNSGADAAALRELTRTYINENEKQLENLKDLKTKEFEAYENAADAKTELLKQQYKDEAKLLALSIMDAEVQLDTLTKTFQNNTLKINADAANIAELENKKRIAEYKSYLEQRRIAEQTIEDLRINAIDDDTERELERTSTRYERLKQLALNNENLTQKERNDIIQGYERERIAKLKDIRDNAAAIEQSELIDADLRLRELELQLQQARFDALDDAEIYNDEISLERRLELIRVQAERENELLAEQHELDLERLEQEYEGKEHLHAEFLAKKALLDEEYANGVIDVDAKILKAKEDDAAKELALQKQKNQAIQDVSGMVLGAISANLEEGSELAKGFAAAEATYATFNAAIGAYNSVVGTPFVGPVLAPIAAAAAAGFGFANVKKILSTDSKGKGSSSPAPSTNMGSSGMATSIPEFNFFGNENPTGGDSSQFDVVDQTNEQPPIRAVVSWTDIDAVGRADDNLRREMQL